MREPSDEHELVGLSELRLAGLDDEEAHALLASSVSGHLDAPVSDRIIAETRGNPLALTELAHGRTAAELAGGFALPDVLDIPAQIEERYRQRIDQLPATTQQLILLAAADPAGDPVLLRRAAATLGLALDSAEPELLGRVACWSDCCARRAASIRVKHGSSPGVFPGPCPGPTIEIGIRVGGRLVARRPELECGSSSEPEAPGAKDQ